MSDISLKNYTVFKRKILGGEPLRSIQHFVAYPRVFEKTKRVRYPFLFANNDARLLRRFIEVVEASNNRLTLNEWNARFEAINHQTYDANDLKAVFADMEVIPA